jgi:hypothetical protein
VTARWALVDEGLKPSAKCSEAAGSCRIEASSASRSAMRAYGQALSRRLVAAQERVGPFKDQQRGARGSRVNDASSGVAMQ